MKNFLIFITFFLWIEGVRAASPEPVVMMTESFPPNQYVKDGELRGITVSIVKELMRRLGYDPKISIVGWNAGYQQILDPETKNHALFATLRTEEREDKFKWVGPLSTATTVLLKKKEIRLSATHLKMHAKPNPLGSL